MLLLDLTKAKPAISHEFALTNERAIQCMAIDPEHGDFYVSQAEGSTKPEDIIITHNMMSLGFDGVRRGRRISSMRLVDAGHGSTISTLRLFDKLGILVNAWGRLRWIPYVAGAIVKQGSPTAGRPMFGGWTHAYVDHEDGSICLRKGNTFSLYELLDPSTKPLGRLLGEASKDTTSEGPSQGFCSMRVSSEEHYLFTMWDYGRPTSRPAIVVGSLRTGEKLYSLSARVLPPRYVRQEPESGFGLGGTFHLGMSLVEAVPGKDRKTGAALAFPTSLSEGIPVVMYVRDKRDPVWGTAPYEITARTSGGRFNSELKRTPGTKLTGHIVDHPTLHVPYLLTISGNYYRLSYLTTERPR